MAAASAVGCAAGMMGRGWGVAMGGGAGCGETTQQQRKDRQAHAPRHYDIIRYTPRHATQRFAMSCSAGLRCVSVYCAVPLFSMCLCRPV